MPLRLFHSSGDLMADRRFEFARDLQLKGDLPAAADLIEQAIELAPNFTSAWFTLGEIRAQLGERDKAIAAFRKSREADPDDKHGAHLHLIRLGDEQLSEMPKAYVQALFDQYAPRFEHVLVNDLGYRAPSLIFKAVVAARVAAKKPALFKRAIDLGCGTGLAAAAFAKQVDHFVGIDLSPGMIKQARATGLYAELEVADMIEGLRGKDDASVNLVVAADAFVYLSDLAPVLSEAQRVLASGASPRIGWGARLHAGDAWWQRHRSWRRPALCPFGGICTRCACDGRPQAVDTGVGLAARREQRAGQRSRCRRRKNLSLGARRSAI